MFQKTLHRFRELPDSTRAMIVLFWVYDFSQSIVGLFLNVFVFLETKSLFDLIIYNLVFFLFVGLGFSGWAYLLSRTQASLKYNYLRAFLIYILSFSVLIFLPHTFAYLLLFGALNGLGLGMFWVGVHGYEMLTTSNENRDFYSSMVSLGAQFFAILSPFIATLSFYLSSTIFHLETFQLLFWILPLVYLCSLPVIFKLPAYTPPKIPTVEWIRLFFSPALSTIRRYIFWGSLMAGLNSVLLPAIAILSLKTVLNLGIFQTLAGVFSILTILVLSHKRHEGNRVSILFYAIFSLILSLTLLLFWQESPVVYMLFSLLLILIQPIYRVSEHVLDLHSMDLLSGEQGFYPGMVYRDIVIWLGRTLALLVILGLSAFLSEARALQAGILLSMLTYGAIFYSAKRMK